MSSGDPLSPTDLFEPFSPPTPPVHPPTPHALTQHTPSLQVSPYLHPKHLLQDIILPWKKVILLCVRVYPIGNYGNRVGILAEVGV